jgi:hypothetical protein
MSAAVTRRLWSRFHLEVVWYPSFGSGILEFILEFHRRAVWLPQNWVIISFMNSSKMTLWVNTIPSWDLSFAILYGSLYKFNIEFCCHLQFLWQPNKCLFLKLQCKLAWLPNDFLFFFHIVLVLICLRRCCLPVLFITVWLLTGVELVLRWHVAFTGGYF